MGNTTEYPFRDGEYAHKIHHVRNIKNQPRSAYSKRLKNELFKAVTSDRSNRIIAEDHSHSQNEERYFCFGLVAEEVITGDQY